MAKLNVKTQHFTHEGAKASVSSPINELERAVATCLLWEKTFYESGESVADRIQALVKQCKPYEVSELAIKARNEYKMRHAPLLLCRALAAIPGGLTAETLSTVIQRPDELTEFLAIYWQKGKQPLTRQIKKGLATAFKKFSAYQLAKYNRDGSIKLRDVLFMVHAKPINDEQASVWKQLVDGTLPAPDTWEVALSSGSDVAETFTRLITDGKLGYMALLRNLRNMAEAGVSSKLVGDALEAGAGKSKALPFRFVAAARAVPAWEPMIDNAMMLAMAGLEKLPGKTVILVDVSGSMNDRLSAKSDLSRLDAASALAVLIRGVCSEVRVFTFSNNVIEVPPRHGMALIDAISRSQAHCGTYLGAAVMAVDQQINYDRIIVVTDEQSTDSVPKPKGGGFMINVATYKNTVGYGQWIKINGFSESIIDFIAADEKLTAR